MVEMETEQFCKNCSFQRTPLGVFDKAQSRTTLKGNTMQTINIENAEILYLGETALRSIDRGKVYKMALAKDSVYEMQIKANDNSYLKLVCFDEEGYLKASIGSFESEYRRADVFELEEWMSTGDFTYFILEANSGEYTGTVKIEEFTRTLRTEKGSSLSHEEMDKNFLMASKKRKVLDTKLYNSFYGTSDRAIFGEPLNDMISANSSREGGEFPEINHEDNEEGEMVMAELKVMARPAGTTDPFVFVHIVSVFRITEDFIFEEIGSSTITEAHDYLVIKPVVDSSTEKKLVVYSQTTAPAGEEEVDMEFVGTITYNIEAERYQMPQYIIVD